MSIRITPFALLLYGLLFCFFVAFSPPPSLLIFLLFISSPSLYFCPLLTPLFLVGLLLDFGCFHFKGIIQQCFRILIYFTSAYISVFCSAPEKSISIKIRI